MSKTDGDAGPSRTRSSRRSIVTASTEDRVNISSSPVKTRPIRLSDAVATNTIATNTTTASSSPKATTKGKEKEHASTPASAETPGASSSKLGKRVLPARLRRAAGGGQDGIRDLEEMIVDWLDRYGSPSDTPPDKLKITITSLPLNMVDPPTYTVGAEAHYEAVTITPAIAGSSSSRNVIETPDWMMVKAGQDDQEEAREELSAKMAASPVRRLRRLSIGDDHTEDTSDEHYIRLHKKYEAFEKRQRKDERDKLAFERYKMRTRIDLLKGMSVSAWSAVVWTVMAREDASGHWAKGKDKVKEEGVDWLRRRLVREGEEVMKRYDQLLPPDPRKSRLLDSRNSTPTPSMGSVSPPPAVLPARVAALKDNTVVPRRRSLPSQMNGAPSKRKRTIQETPLSPPKPTARRAVSSPRTQSESGSEALTDLSSEEEHDEHDQASRRTRTETPSESASTVPSSIVSPVSAPLRKGTRASARQTTTSKPVKPATRTSARLSQPSATVATRGSDTISQVIDVHSPSIPDTAAFSPEPQKPHNGNLNPFYHHVLPQLDVSPDEQLEMDRVEAAVVI